VFHLAFTGDRADVLTSVEGAEWWLAVRGACWRRPEGRGDLLARPVDKGTPTFRDFYCSDILVDGAKRAVVIEGLPENPMYRVSLENVFVKAAQTGVSCYQVRALSLSNMVVNAETGPPLECKNVRDVEVIRVRAPKVEANVPVIELKAVQDAVIESCATASDGAALIRVSGGGNRDITLALNRVSKESKEIVFADGASEQAVVKHT